MERTCTSMHLHNFILFYISATKTKRDRSPTSHQGVQS